MKQRFKSYCRAASAMRRLNPLPAASCGNGLILLRSAVSRELVGLFRFNLFVKRGLFAFALLGGFAVAPGQILINGAGATFPYPLYSRWFDEYAKIDSTVRFNYQSIGSGGGQRQILARTVDFGGSDCPISDEDLAKAPARILHIPTVAGAVVVTYNLPGNPVLRLDGPLIADIFLGKVTSWNDRRIAQLNPGMQLPKSELVVVHRSDGSGTSYIFTDFLSQVSPNWKARVGCNTSVKWPTGLGAKGNEGLAGQIKQLPGTIGYVELAYARQNGLPCAEVKNAAGKFVAASVVAVTAALAAAKVPDDLRFSMVDPPGDEAYPIAGATWLLVYEHQRDAAKGKRIVEFLNWALVNGEGLAADLDYAPLPENIEKRVLERIKTIKF
jgi:phosphate transport system substrate-binding protein